MTEPTCCAWCYAVLVPGGKGRPRRFCSGGCKANYWHSARILGRALRAIVRAEWKGVTARLTDAARQRAAAGTGDGR